MTKGLHRYYGAHHLHFITCSCCHRQPQLGTPERRDLFLSILEEARQKYRFVVHGYVIMPEHFHLLMTEPELGDPSVVMKVIKERFSRRVNQSRAGAPLIASFAMSGFPRPGPRSGLAETLLRFQRVDRTEANREAALHAPQTGVPSKPGFGLLGWKPGSPASPVLACWGGSR